MDKLRRALSGDDGAPQANDSGSDTGGFHEIIDASSLSWSTRIKGFLGCFIGGFLISLLGSLCLFLGNLKGFGILYTFGSVIGLLSTMFLMGPVNQVKKMCASTRVIATFIMLLSLFLTLWSALYWKKNGLVLIFIIIQFLAMTWYSISYIPFARDAVKKTLGSMC